MNYVSSMRTMVNHPHIFNRMNRLGHFIGKSDAVLLGCAHAGRNAQHVPGRLRYFSSLLIRTEDYNVYV